MWGVTFVNACFGDHPTGALSTPVNLRGFSATVLRGVASAASPFSASCRFDVILPAKAQLGHHNSSPNSSRPSVSRCRVILSVQQSGASASEWHPSHRQWFALCWLPSLTSVAVEKLTPRAPSVGCRRGWNAPTYPAAVSARRRARRRTRRAC